MELKKKGELAAISSSKRLRICLSWSAAVDLDLMAFFKLKDGRVGGIYSENYSGGNLGRLDAFPFMQLSGDAGTGGTVGSHWEEMTVSRVDEVEELWIVAVNFDAASRKTGGAFADLDANVTIETDRNEVYQVALDSREPGSVAVLCKITSNFMGPQIRNESQVIDFEQFRTSAPGASDLKILSKVTLQRKGDSHVLQLKKKTGNDGIVINLNWKTNADLDLGCFYELRPDSDGGGFLSRLLPASESLKGVIDGLQFSRAGGPRDRVTRQGCYTQRPFVWHMGDDRSGSQMAEGEFILINPQGFSVLRRMTIYAFIYEGVARWEQTDAVVTIRVPGNPELVVEMGRQSSRKTFVAIAGLEFTGASQIRVTRHVTFHDDHSSCDRVHKWGMRWQAGGK